MHFEYNRELIENINRWNMEIDDSGFVYLSHDNWCSEAVCSPFSRVYLISDGEGQIDIGKERLLLRPGYAYFIPAGLTFSYGCADYLEKLYFHLRLVKPDGYDLACGLKFMAECPVERSLFENMLRRYRGNSWEDVLELEQEIRALTFRLLNQYDIMGKSVAAYSLLVEETMRYIHAHLSAGVTARQIAEALFVSEITLSRRFRQETGRTIHRYVEDMVFQAACKRLAVSSQPIGEISGELGFCDPFYFSRRFHQLYGEPPSRYRSRLQVQGLSFS